jgi:hypothetical protein
MGEAGKGVTCWSESPASIVTASDGVLGSETHTRREPVARKQGSRIWFPVEQRKTPARETAIDGAKQRPSTAVFEAGGGTKVMTSVAGSAGRADAAARGSDAGVTDLLEPLQAPRTAIAPIKEATTQAQEIRATRPA